jgi:NADH:ubiquinone oxidoreductase subunit E
MDNFQDDRESDFRLEGRFLGFASNQVGKVKYLRVAVETSEWQIKLPKESRATLGRVLLANDWIQVLGEKKLNQRTGQLKLKARQVHKLTLETEPTCAQVKPLPEQGKKKILVCQKSGCLKRGGKRLCQDLEAALCDRGLQDQVVIERTGCLKRCSQAPNVILMPGKSRLSGMHPDAIAALLDSLSST